VAFERGLVELSGKPSPLYEHAAKANREVANLGRALRFLTSTGVGHVPGRHEKDGHIADNPLPTGTMHWREVKARPAGIRDIRIAGTGSGNDAVIGFFRDDAGEKYFMVVNLWHDAGKSAVERTLTVTIKFAPEVRTVTRLSRETGTREKLPVQDGTLTLELPGGTGDLLRLGPGSFPGMD